MKRTPEQKAAELRFLEQALALVRGQIYRDATESVWQRERADLIMAVSEPAAFLRRDGLAGTAGMYLEILKRVLGEIHRDLSKSRNRPIFLRRCLANHMRIRGETYRDQAKSLGDRNAGKLASALLRKLKPVAGDPAGDLLTDSLCAARELIEGSKRRNARE